MNRSMVGVSASLVVAAFVLITFPLWATGAEQFDLEQEIGILFLPFGLVTMLVGLTAPDPERTTIGGTFGNSEYDRRPRAAAPRTLAAQGRAYSPLEPVSCAYCRTYIDPSLAQCPRCARARDCRTCSRPLGMVLDRATCPTCARAEPLCNCPPIARAATPRSGYERVRARRR